MFQPARLVYRTVGFVTFTSKNSFQARQKRWSHSVGLYLFSAFSELTPKKKNTENGSSASNTSIELNRYWHIKALDDIWGNQYQVQKSEPLRGYCRDHEKNPAGFLLNLCKDQAASVQRPRKPPSSGKQHLFQRVFCCFGVLANLWESILPETNIAMENPPFWWYLPRKMGIVMGELLVSGRGRCFLFHKKKRNKIWKKKCLKPSTSPVFSAFRALKTQLHRGPGFFFSDDPTISHLKTTLFTVSTWRIIPFSKRLVTPIYKPCRPLNNPI